MKIFKHFLLSIFLLIPVLFSGCHSNVESVSQKGNLILAISGISNARTVFPTIQEETLTNIMLSYNKIGTEDQIIKEWNNFSEVTPFSVDVGTYNFTLKAEYNGFIYSGTLENVKIKSGDNIIEINLRLNEIDTDAMKGQGTINHSLTFPQTDEVKHVKAGLYKYDEDDNLVIYTELEEVEVIDNEDGTFTVSYSKENDSGEYVLKYFFYADEEESLCQDVYSVIVYILKDTTSEADETTEKLCSVYSVTYDLNNGSWAESYTAPSQFTYLDPLVLPLPEKVIRQGYDFVKWSLKNNIDGEEVTHYNNLNDIKVYAIWRARTDTSYTVKHWQQNIENDEYTLIGEDTELLTGTTETETTAIAKEYTGFEICNFEQETIAGDGTTIVNLYYNRKIFFITLNIGDGSTETELDEYNRVSGRYGAAVNISIPVLSGYTFKNWINEDGQPEALPEVFTENRTFIADYESLENNAGIVLKVNILNGDIKIVSTDTTSESMTITAEEGYSDYKWTVNGELQNTTTNVLTYQFNDSASYRVSLIAQNKGIKYSSDFIVTKQVNLFYKYMNSEIDPEMELSVSLDPDGVKFTKPDFSNAGYSSFDIVNDLDLNESTFYAFDGTYYSSKYEYIYPFVMPGETYRFLGILRTNDGITKITNIVEITTENGHGTLSITKKESTTVEFIEFMKNVKMGKDCTEVKKDPGTPENSDIHKAYVATAWEQNKNDSDYCWDRWATNGYGTDYRNIPLGYIIRYSNYYSLTIDTVMECTLVSGEEVRLVLQNGRIDTEFQIFQFPLVNKTIINECYTFSFLDDNEVIITRKGENNSINGTWGRSLFFDEIIITFDDKEIVGVYDIENEIFTITSNNDDVSNNIEIKEIPYWSQENQDSPYLDGGCKIILEDSDGFSFDSSWFTITDESGICLENQPVMSTAENTIIFSEDQVNAITGDCILYIHINGTDDKYGDLTNYDVRGRILLLNNKTITIKASDYTDVIPSVGLVTIINDEPIISSIYPNGDYTISDILLLNPVTSNTVGSEYVTDVNMKLSKLHIYKGRSCTFPVSVGNQIIGLNQPYRAEGEYHGPSAESIKYEIRYDLDGDGVLESSRADILGISKYDGDELIVAYQRESAKIIYGTEISVSPHETASSTLTSSEFGSYWFKKKADKIIRLR